MFTLVITKLLAINLSSQSEQNLQYHTILRNRNTTPQKQYIGQQSPNKKYPQYKLKLLQLTNNIITKNYKLMNQPVVPLDKLYESYRLDELKEKKISASKDKKIQNIKKVIELHKQTKNNNPTTRQNFQNILYLNRQNKHIREHTNQLILRQSLEPKNSIIQIPKTNEVVTDLRRDQEQQSSYNIKNSSNFSIPLISQDLKSNKYSLHNSNPKFQDDDHYSDPQIPQAGNIYGGDEIPSNLNIPKISNLGQKTIEIQDEIVEGDGLLSLQMYKQYRKKKLKVDGKLQVNQFSKAFAFYIFELLKRQQSEEQKLIELKNQILSMKLYQSLSQSRWVIMKQHAQEEITQKQVKRLFYEYFLSIFDNYSSIQIIQEHIVLADILDMIVQKLAQRHAGSLKNQEFVNAIETGNPQKVFPFFAQAFGVKYQLQGDSRFVFSTPGGYKLIIEKGKQKYRAWLQQ